MRNHKDALDTPPPSFLSLPRAPSSPIGSSIMQRKEHEVWSHVTLCLNFGSATKLAV